MGGPELPKFSGDRDDFEEYHDEMSNYAVSKHFDDVWSAKAHRYFPDDTIDVQLRSRKQKKVIKKNNKAISCLRGSFMNSSELLTFISQSVDAIPEREDKLVDSDRITKYCDFDDDFEYCDYEVTKIHLG